LNINTLSGRDTNTADFIACENETVNCHNDEITAWTAVEDCCTTTWTEENYTGCSGDSYCVSFNGNFYKEDNPTGIEVLTDENGCDSIILINLTFNEIKISELNYSGCAGNGYSVVANGTLYNEDNPIGAEILFSSVGCDSIIYINLEFINDPTGEEHYVGCNGDGHFITINGSVYDEDNPAGTEIISAAGGCDSTVIVNMEFLPSILTEETYIGCIGDGYSVVFNGNTYDETTPNGIEILAGSNGCDTTVTIDLTFRDHPMDEETYTGCEEDCYSVFVNGTVYDQSNPTGIEEIPIPNGCDSIVIINLVFGNTIQQDELYTGCIGDGYSVIVNGNIYNETNPAGTELLLSGSGCDTTVNINLTFLTSLTSTETHDRCEGDSFSIIVNGTTYSEANPAGMETLTTTNGCDSIVTINLVFEAVDNSVMVNISSLTAIADGAYQWVDCDNDNEPISGATEQTFVPSVTGNYAVLITENDCTVTSDCNLVVVGSPQGTTINDQVSFFPNPTNGPVQLDFGNLEGVTIRLRDRTGKLILEMTTVNLPIQELEIPGPAGVYYLEVRTAEDQEQFMLVK